MKDIEGGIAGTIEGWHVSGRHKGQVAVIGTIYGHSRFPEGGWIITSGTKQESFKEGDVVVTRNSRYLLGKAREELINI